jgi:hypothetical protein
MPGERVSMRKIREVLRLKCKRELIATFPGSGVTTRLPIDTMGDGKNGRGVAEDLLRP